jgi:hypothetical protein
LPKGFLDLAWQAIAELPSEHDQPTVVMRFVRDKIT